MRSFVWMGVGAMVGCAPVAEVQGPHDGVPSVDPDDRGPGVTAVVYDGSEVRPTPEIAASEPMAPVEPGPNGLMLGTAPDPSAWVPSEDHLVMMPSVALNAGWGAPGTPDWDVAVTSSAAAQIPLDTVAALGRSARTQVSGAFSVPCAGPTAAYRGGQGFADLQEALDASTLGPVVLVCPGTHSGPFVSGSADLVLAPAIPFTHPTLTGHGSAPVLAAGSRSTQLVAVLDVDLVDGFGVSKLQADTVVFAGSDVVGHIGAYAGALDIDAESTAVVVGNRVEDNVAGYEAGGLGMQAPIAVVWGNAFVGNTAGYEGGALEMVHDIWNPVGGLLLVAFNHFEDNAADYSGGALELGIRWSPLRAVLLANTWIGNAAPAQGGALQVGPSEGWVGVFGDRFVGNESRSGAAVSFDGWGVTDGLLVDVEVTDNVGPDAVFLHGVHVPAATAHVTIVGGSFARNTTSGGAALHVRDGYDVDGFGIDFGVGGNANSHDDVQGCGSGLGAGVDLEARRRPNPSFPGPSAFIVCR